MTVSQSIIMWLKTFNSAEYWKMKSIDTDMQSAIVSTYSLVKEPVANVKHYMSGKKEHTDHYQIMARLDSQNNTDRIDNGAWGEALTDWIEANNRNKAFPVLDEGTVSAISVTTPFYMGKTDTHNSLYQMTIAIKYVKER